MASFVVAFITIIARSVGNLISYFAELEHSKEIIVNQDQKQFDIWFKATYSDLYDTMTLFYMILIGLRNLSLILNLTRWFIVEAGLQKILKNQIEALDWIESYKNYGKFDANRRQSDATNFVTQVFSREEEKEETDVINIEDGTKQIDDREDFNADMFFQQNNL